MATDPSYSQLAAQAALDAITAKLNVGGAGSIKIRTGAQPANLEAADTGTVLATLALSATSFGTATAVTSPRGAQATAAAITSDTSADATGDAGHFRAYNNAGVAVIQGTVAAATADLILNTISIVAGATVAISAWTLTLPDGD